MIANDGWSMEPVQHQQCTIRSTAFYGKDEMHVSSNAKCDQQHYDG